ncbi:MAG: hypothetical protein ABIP97_00685 [Chthoniobacterales bacterium]
MKSAARKVVTVCLLLFVCSAAFGRTIALQFDDCDLMAAIVEEGPRHSWASSNWSTPIFSTISITPGIKRSFLIRFPLDKIPKGQHIVYAEWTLNPHVVVPNSRLFIWRLLVDWGAGVNYNYRMLRPKPLAWTVPGARGNSSDRGTKPSAIIRMSQPGEQIVNVTEDVELWYTGAAPNYGWLICLEDTDSYVRMLSPLYENRLNWELRVTYEP